jgi:hypothetical protein
MLTKLVFFENSKEERLFMEQFNMAMEIERASLYGMLASYYQFTNPALSMHYAHKYNECVEKLAQFVEYYGDPYELGINEPKAEQTSKAFLSNPYVGSSSQQPIPYIAPIPNVDPVDPAPNTWLRADGAKIRALHVSPDAPKVDIYANGQLLISGLGYGNTTSYAQVPVGQYSIEVFLEGQKEHAKPIITKKLTVENSNAYTVAVLNQLANLNLMAYMDDITPTPGKAKIRLIHLSPDAPNVDVGIKGGDLIFSNVGYKQATKYITADPGKMNLLVYPSGSKQAVLEVPGVELKAGMNYSAVASGLVNGKPSLEVFLLMDMES